MGIIIVTSVLLVSITIGWASAGISFDRLHRSERREADRIRAVLEMKDGAHRSRNYPIG